MTVGNFIKIPATITSEKQIMMAPSGGQNSQKVQEK